MGKRPESQKESKEAKAQEKEDMNTQGPEENELKEREGEASPDQGEQMAKEKEIAQETPPLAEDFKAKYLYLAAELENQRKRFQREREAMAKFGNEKILSDFIEVADNLERTIAAVEGATDKKVKNIVTGVNMVKKQFLETLERHGLIPLESLGKEFDPNVHEAMGQEESEGESNRIISVFEQGYKLHGRLLRAAKVIVSK